METLEEIVLTNHVEQVTQVIDGTTWSLLRYAEDTVEVIVILTRVGFTVAMEPETGCVAGVHDTGEPVAVIWPRGTTITNDGSGLLLEDGRFIPDKTALSGGGGFWTSFPVDSEVICRPEEGQSRIAMGWFDGA